MIIAIPLLLIYLLSLVLPPIVIIEGIRRSKNNPKERQKRNKTLTIITLCIVAVSIPIIAFAKISDDSDQRRHSAEPDCLNEKSLNKYYPELTTNANNPEYPIQCVAFEFQGAEIQYYGKTRSSCATVGIIAGDPESLCRFEANDNLHLEGVIANTVIFFTTVITIVISYILLLNHKRQKDNNKKTMLENLMAANWLIELIALAAYFIIQL